MEERIIPVKGMHCRSCELLIKHELEALPTVQKARASLGNKNVYIAAKKGMRLPSEASIAAALKTAGYSVGYERDSLFTHERRVYIDVTIGFILVAVIAFILRTTDFSKLVYISQGSSGALLPIALIGLTAGFSTCMALIGGLVLGVSARYAEKHPTFTALQKFRPHLLFNLGRVGGFAILGGLIGTIGNALQLSSGLLGWFTILIGASMLMLGLSLTNIFPGLKNIFALPAGIADKLGIHHRKNREFSWHNTILTGALTFFLPCGFTQAMQLLAVSSGSFASGAAIMAAFALGTTPGLLAVGGLTAVIEGDAAKGFFRIAGVAVIAMALINISTGANLARIRLPDLRAQQSAKNLVPADAQIITATFTNNDGLQPKEFSAKVGQKTSIVVDVKQEGQGCMSTILIPGLYDKIQFLKGNTKVIMTFTPTKPGTYLITCAMGLKHGTLEVRE